MDQYGIGQAVSRFEDPRLLRGAGRYVNDVSLPHQAYAMFLRSPHAHAKIAGIDITAAKAAPGVLGIYTEADVAADKLGTTRLALPRKRADGSPAFARPHPGLARGYVRYVGDPVALVVAETLAQAKDAAELIEIAYEPLPSVSTIDDALKPGAPRVWDENPDNISHIFETGNKAAADAAFAGAAHVVRGRYVITRVYAQYMEPRGTVGAYDPSDERYTLHADVQYAHRVRDMLAGNVFKIPETQIRVVTGDVGGGFGTKGWQYVEHRLTLWAAKKLGRPVKWCCERSEALLADEHGRDVLAEAELALAPDGKFLGLRVRLVSNIGAYLSSDRNLLATFGSLGALVGVYDIPAAYAHLTVAFSNAPATAPYRGAGRPEAIYIIERLVEDAARSLGIDRIALRAKNLIPPARLPYKTPLGGLNYDCGDFPGIMDKALKLGDAAGFAQRRAASTARGRLRGLGIANAIERAASPGPEFAELRFNTGGQATLLMGTIHQGQGHETSFKQIAIEKLGLAPGDIRFVDGDTDMVAFGTGTNGSRSTVIGGTAVTMAAEKIIVKTRKIAAHLLEASEADVQFAGGRFTIAGTDRGLDLKEVARAAFLPGKLPKGMEPGLYETGTFSPPQDTFPNGCHLCEVEIDPDTGKVELASYVVVDDVGTVINPKLLKGQIHGGVAQGAGQALMEQVVYDRESGQLLSASFMDYAMPRAEDFPDIQIESAPVPTKLNPLGAKGAGEAGTVGALPAVMLAILDALGGSGVTQLDMPATPERVWRAIEDAKK
ncbi:MAG TPA: xanthine dehydrogenase family protein molybdopterin-binding subunit [Stellaceae bacterium]|jgi:carbon-monoxide dehydrogenase large subunit|nr:xanthine dehydrogenase family protein molybdopterin-binding subunit [Stellaceae bacterium]